MSKVTCGGARTNRVMVSEPKLATSRLWPGSETTPTQSSTTTATRASSKRTLQDVVIKDLALLLANLGQSTNISIK
jgi:Na+-transporting NADH:ubiquinone oxidoreductase subunit NqrA